MLKIEPSKNFSHYDPGPTGPADHLSVYLSSKIVGGFCELKPLTARRVNQIAQDGDYSSIVEGQSGWRASLAREVLLPLLQKHLPEFVETKLGEVKSKAIEKLPFPKELFQTTLQEMNSYYSDVIRAYRETAKDPYLATTIEKGVEEKLERIYLKEGRGEETLLILGVQKILEETVFKKSLQNVPWPFKAPVSLFLYSVSFTLRHLLPLFAVSLPKTPDPVAGQLDILVQIAACRFLDDLKDAVRDSSSSRLSLDRKLLETYLQKETLILRLNSCTSQGQINKVLNDNSTLRWIQDKFVFTNVAKEAEEMIGAAWSIIKKPSWRKQEANHFLQSFNDFFQNPGNLVDQPSDIDSELEGLIVEILGKKLPSFLDFIKQPIAELAVAGKEQLLEKKRAFWIKPPHLRFGLLHRQILMRFLG